MTQPERPARTRSIASWAEAAPSRSTSGSGPVKSITVDGVPGSGPRSSSAATAAADPVGHVGERRGIRASRLVGTRREHTADRSKDTLRRPRADRPRERRSRRHARRSATDSARPGFGSTSVYGPGSSSRTIASDRPRSSGMQSRAASRRPARAGRSAEPARGPSAGRGAMAYSSRSALVARP